MQQTARWAANQHPQATQQQQQQVQSLQQQQQQQGTAQQVAPRRALQIKPLLQNPAAC